MSRSSIALVSALLLALHAVALPAAESRVFHPTRLRYLPDNDAAWYARWWALNEASTSIRSTYFNFHKDLFGKAMLGLLLAKARQGVGVELMVDSRGSLSLTTRWMAQAFLRELAKQPSAKVRVYRPLAGEILKVPRYLRDVVASNHDKILLADGHLAVVGGRNLGTKYFASPSDDEGAYVDNDLLLDGPGVGGEIEVAFRSEFDHLHNLDLGAPREDDEEIVAELALAARVMDAWVRGQGPIDPGTVAPKLAKVLKKLSAEAAKLPRLTGYQAFEAAPFGGVDSTYPVEILDKGSFGSPVNTITENLLARFAGAQQKLVIQSAYLVMTDRIKAALRTAGERGVEIVILTNSPASTSNLLTQAFFVKEWKSYLKDIPNLRLYITTSKHKIHAKTFVIDGAVTCIGSYNLDPMSEGINGEILSLVESTTLSAEVEARIREQVAGAVECTIRIGEDGEPIGVTGPDDYLQGVAGMLIRILAHVPFLRELV